MAGSMSSTRYSVASKFCGVYGRPLGPCTVAIGLADHLARSQSAAGDQSETRFPVVAAGSGGVAAVVGFADARRPAHFAARHHDYVFVEPALGKSSSKANNAWSSCGALLAQAVEIVLVRVPVRDVAGGIAPPSFDPTAAERHHAHARFDQPPRQQELVRPRRLAVLVAHSDPAHDSGRTPRASCPNRPCPAPGR